MSNKIAEGLPRCVTLDEIATSDSGGIIADIWIGCVSEVLTIGVLTDPERGLGIECDNASHISRCICEWITEESWVDDAARWSAAGMTGAVFLSGFEGQGHHKT